MQQQVHLNGQALARALKRLALSLSLVVVLLLGSDVLRLNPAERVSLRYHYSLVAWEADNLLSKWVHRLASALPWHAGSTLDRPSRIREYFRLGGEISTLDAELEQAAARIDERRPDEVARLDAELARLRATRNDLRNDVEEAIEATVSSVIAEQGVSSWGGLIFPPVDVRLGEPPLLLVTSPRGSISRLHDVLLWPRMNILQGERMEGALLQDWDISALVTRIGGVATYPASVDSRQTLRWTLDTTAHEWLHQYLVFRPLGRSIYVSPDMQTLNETFADVAGREIGGHAFEKLGGTVALPGPVRELEMEVTEQAKELGFDFDAEMRATRRRVDELLFTGAIEQAEAYMEERRKLFVDNGFAIRKLNQAYFAFHGTYAESPASVSPIGDQLHEFRELVPDLSTFIETMSQTSSYQQFVDILNGLRAGGGR